jgi:hypothetical protein
VLEPRCCILATDACSGFFGHGDMQKEFEEAAFKLDKGKVSDLVDTASGLHLIQRLECMHTIRVSR